MLKALAADAFLLRHRTVVWVVCGVALLAISVLGGQSIRDMAPPSAAELTQAQQTYQAKLAEWEAEHEQWERACIEDGGSHEQCAVPRPTPESYQPWQADYRIASGITILVAAALLAVTMYVVGALYVGGDFASGAMTTWLTHQPRRMVLTVSKLTTVGVLSLVAGVLVFGVLLIALNLAARAWQVPVTQDHLVGSLISAGRGTLLVMLGGLIGASAAFITRRSAVAIGMAAVYTLLNRVTVSLNIGTGAAPALDLITQAQAWVGGGTTLTYWDNGMFQELRLNPTLGGVIWGVLSTVMLIAALLTQRFRDPQ
ncbi:hypothetical protein [Enemella sp. A6]|uniref:hypothetical protein n=1 Tax=Enemella sp. A6 TaxID=3440152 RepID=UPI003EC0E004